MLRGINASLGWVAATTCTMLFSTTCSLRQGLCFTAPFPIFGDRVRFPRGCTYLEDRAHWLLLRSPPSTNNDQDYPDFGEPPDTGSLRMLSRRDVNSQCLTRSLNPYCLYGDRAGPDDLTMIGTLRLPEVRWDHGVVSREASAWSFAPQLREYFKFIRLYSNTVLTVLYAGLRGEHVSITVPAGGPEGRRWPTGTVTVFFQSSRHLQVSIWSEAFAILIDCLIHAYYRFLRSSTAQDPTLRASTSTWALSSPRL